MRFPRRAGMVAVTAVAVMSAALPAIAASPLATIGQAVSSVLPSVTPGFARTAAKVSDVDPTTPVQFSILLRGRNDANLASLARAVSDPTSSEFRQFLTRQQTVALLDPAPAVTALVVTALKALGIQVTQVSSDGRLVNATASAGLITRVLGVRFANLRAPGGAIERVALNQPLLPAALRPLVSAIVGLSATPVQHFATPPVTVSTAPAPAFFNARPCTSYYGQALATSKPKYQGKFQPFTVCGYSPAQIRAAYRVPQTGLTGKGVRIGVVDDYDSPTIVADTNHYSALHGLPPLAPGQFVDHTDPVTKSMPEVILNDPTGAVGTVPIESPQDWAGEQTLDVEMVHVMAPGATIHYYAGVQGLGLQPLEAAFAEVIADDEVQFVSDSWGIFEQDLLVTPADFELMETLLEIGSIEGIGASFSSGDDGDNIEMWDVKSADFPASSDMATAVGGTSLVIGANNTYVGETYWGTRLEPLTSNGRAWNGTPKSGGEGPATGPGTIAGAAGGGVSSIFAEPSWQQRIVPASLTTQTYTSPDGQNTNNVTKPGRVVPDISLDADSTTGVLVGQTQTEVNGKAAYSEFRIGGTSVSSPLFAGLMALAIQLNHGQSLGFVSPSLYSAYTKSPHGFRDPVLGRNLVNVRTDFVNTQDFHSSLVFRLRLLGQLSTLKDLRGYDNSTGLGSPCASVLVKAVVHPTTAEGVAPGCGR